MTFHQRQNERLSVQLMTKQQEFNRQRSMLFSKIQLLESEIIDQHEKQRNNRKLNESIILSCKQQENIREQFTVKQMENVRKSYEEDYKKIKKSQKQDKKKHQIQCNQLKQQNQKQKIEIQKLRLIHQKQIAEIRQQYEQKMEVQLQNLQQLYQQKIESLNERVKKSQNQNTTYKEIMEKRHQQIQSMEKQSLQKGKILVFDNDREEQYPYLQNIKKLNQGDRQITKRTQINKTALNERINRAINRLKPSNSILEQKVLNYDMIKRRY